MLQQTPLPPAVPVAPIAPISGVAAPITAADMYLAAKAYREVLVEQSERLSSTRSEVARALRSGDRTAADLSGLEKQLVVLDDRIVDMEKQIASADVKQALAAAEPGAVQPTPPPVRDNTPDWESVLTGGAVLSFALLFPFVIAFSRRVWRRSARTTVMLPPEVATRLQSMEEAIESVAVEVERIGEGQRFMTQALSDNTRGLGAGAAQPVPVRARELLPVEQLRR